LKRRLVNLAVAASLVICVTMFVLCVRSFLAIDSLQLGRSTLREQAVVRRLAYLDSDRGTCVFTFRYQHDPLSGEQLAELRHHFPNMTVFYSSAPAPRPGDWTADDSIPLWNTLGFNYYDSYALVARQPNLFDRRLFVPALVPCADLRPRVGAAMGAQASAAQACRA
jgi:hypothetical protein